MDDDRTRLAEGLGGLLADTATLHGTTRAYHWNVEGPQFAQLHAMFERQAADLAGAIDLLARRIRVLGFYAPGTMREYQKRTRLSQPDGVTRADDMLRHLGEGHRQVVHRIRQLLGETEKVLDEATASLLIERLRVHEQTGWMLASQSGGQSVPLGQAPGRSPDKRRTA